jgi:glutathione synthase
MSFSRAVSLAGCGWPPACILERASPAGGTRLMAREKDICTAIGPSLKERGLIFVGIDVIGDYMTEINVTSPTGLQEINRFDGVRLEERVWDAIEARLPDRRR